MVRLIQDRTVKLGLAFDKNQLTQELKDKLKPFIKSEPFIRVTTGKISYA